MGRSEATCTLISSEKDTETTLSETELMESGGSFVTTRSFSGKRVFPTIMKLLGAVCFENYRGHLPCPCGSGLIARKCHGETILKLKKSGATEAFSSDFTTIACELTYLQQSAVKREQALRQTLISLPGKYRASNID